MTKVPVLGVIYDLDGTVADTQGMHGDIEVQLLKEFGITHVSSEELTMRFAGVSLQETFRAVFAEARKHRPDLEYPDLDALSERKRQMLHARWREIKPMPGILRQTEMLRRRGIPLGVASASRLVTIELVLNTLDIRNRFKVIASTKEVERGKPAPDVFLLAAERLGVAPHNCLVIGDGAADILGAKAAGMRCIALWKHAPRLLPAEMIVSDIREIPDQFFD